MERTILTSKIGTAIQTIAGLKEALEENLALQRNHPGQMVETAIVWSMDDDDYEASARLMASAVPTEFASFAFYYGTKTPIVPDTLDDKPHLVFYFDLEEGDKQIARLMKWEGSRWLTRNDYTWEWNGHKREMTVLYADFGNDAEAASLWWAWLIEECYHVPMMPYTYTNSVKGGREKLMKQSVKQAHGFQWSAVPYMVKFVVKDIWRLLAK